MLLEVKNIIKELHQEVLKELFELNRTYPIGEIKEEKSRDRSTSAAYCSFSGKDNEQYQAAIHRWDSYGQSYGGAYTYEFYVIYEGKENANSMTGKNEAIVIFSTVSKILIEIIDKCALADLPIYIHGTKRSNEKGETARDRIYKEIIKKNISRYNYKCEDLENNGVVLIPE